MSDGVRGYIYKCALSDDCVWCMAAMAAPVIQDFLIPGFNDPQITDSAVMSGYLYVMTQEATNLGFTNHHITTLDANVGLLMLLSQEAITLGYPHHSDLNFSG